MDQLQLSGSGGGIPTVISVVDAGGDTTTWPLLATSQTGDISPATDGGLTYQATTNALTATTFIGALQGNADTVTTNANLTGIVTSVGNATAIAAKAISYTKLSDGTAGNIITWDATGVAAVVATGNATQVLTSNGVGLAPTFQAGGAGAADTWTSITAATGASTTANGNNTGIVLNWANTTNTTVAWTFGETSAATNGTSTAGVPNQVLLKLTTLAASTQSPLSVYSRGNHVFSVSPTTSQILAVGEGGAAPPYSFANATGTGMANNTTTIRFFSNGTMGMQMTATLLQIADGTNAAPSLRDKDSFATTGCSWLETNSWSVVDTTDKEMARWTGTGSASGLTSLVLKKGSANTIAYALNFQKARGTSIAPTVITTGDDLATLSGFGYVGATNTYEIATQIKYDSIGTIADTTSGIGGVIRFSTANQGVVGLVEQMTIWNSGDVTIGSPTPATTAAIGFPQLPTMSGTPTGVPTVITGFNPIVYDTTGKKIWIYDYGSAAWKGVAVA